MTTAAPSDRPATTPQERTPPGSSTPCGGSPWPARVGWLLTTGSSWSQESSEAGHGVCRGLGFQDVAQIPLFIRMPG